MIGLPCLEYIFLGYQFVVWNGMIINIKSLIETYKLDKSVLLSATTVLGSPTPKSCQIREETREH